ncbi:unnamed protein product [Paramecium sonneborni]|uniref:Uncharacterized protein n=1 Tax=Paramecium sonneborni TaxID=65129 RepID=A0A8S1R633_9CILI|nr:unnamed protein product [Paramecium sonneborni]
MMSFEQRNYLIVLLIWCLITLCYCETIVYNNFIGGLSDSQVDWWIRYSGPYLSNCGSTQILGGQIFGSSHYIVKTFELNPHYSLRLRFYFWRIDHWNGHRFRVYVDNIEKHNQQYYYSSSSNNICGYSYSDESILLDLSTDHSSPTTQILIAGGFYWGISNFELFIEECPLGCDSCDSNGCFNQILFQQYFVQKKFNGIYFNEGWLSANQIFENGIQWNQFITCRDYSIHSSSYSTLKKIITLEAHDAIGLSLKIITTNLQHQIDLLIDDVLIIYSQISQQVVLNSYTSCDYYEIINQIKIKQHFHKNNKIKITIKARSLSRISNSYNCCYFGIRDFQLFIRPFLNDDYCDDENVYAFDGCFVQIYDCVEGCTNCVKGICLQCQEGWEYQEQTKKCLTICGDSLITHFEECDDGNNIAYDGCYQCKYSCPLECLLCQFGSCLKWKTSYQEFKNYSYSDNLNLKLPTGQKNENHNQCQYLYDSLECYKYINKQTQLFLTCDSQYKINEKRLKQYSKQICGDSIITCNEECDDGNIIQYDGCYKCKYSCPLYCNECKFGICKKCLHKYQLLYGQCYYICDGSENYQVQENKGCYNNINNLIENGHYQYDLLNNIHSKYKIVSSLTCNLEDYGIFGYFYNQCKISEILNCKETLMNKCLECDKFYGLDNNKLTCSPICNDGIVIQQEICDDQNNIQFDGCYKCKQSCLLECINCIGNKCYQCLDGWQLLDYRCYQFCGDGKIAESSMEQCDDGNYIEGDGCFECKFECFPYCESCADRNTCLLCQQFFELHDGKCRPICGDGYVLDGLEECEDGNIIPYDGCYNCQFQCEKECQTCNSIGKCEQCIEGYQIIDKSCQINNEINNYNNDDEEEIEQSQCGNAIYTNDEECDDGNLLNGDGCSNQCTIEFNWFCNNTINKLSNCVPNTVIVLKYLNQTIENQYVQLTFSNQVKLNQVNLNFTNQIKLSIQPAIQNNNYLITIIPVVEIQEKVLLDVMYIIQINILETITTQINLNVEINAKLEDSYQNEVNTSIQTIKLLTSKVLSNTQLQTANNFQALGFWMMIGLSISSLMLLLFGDPTQCMEILDTLQFQSYLKYINVSFPQNLLIYFESSEFVTIQPALVQFKIIDFFEYFIGYQNLKSIGKFFEYQLNADLLISIYGQMTQICFLIGLHVFLKYYTQIIYAYCFGSKYIYYLRVINNKIIINIGIKIYYLNNKILKLKNLFKISGLIQLFHANSWDLIFKVLLYLESNYIWYGQRQIISNIISIGYLIVIMIILIKNFTGYKRKVVLNNLRTEQHENIILIKKLIFLIVLILMQSQPVLQCILLTLVLLFYLGFIVIINFTANKLDLLIIIWMEAPVMLFTLSCLAHCSDFQKKLAIDQQTFVGFLQIGLLILALISPLVRCSYQFYEKLKAQYLKFIKVKKRIKFNVDQIFQVVEMKK